MMKPMFNINRQLAGNPETGKPNKILTDLELFTALGLSATITAETAEACDILRKIKAEDDLFFALWDGFHQAFRQLKWMVDEQTATGIADDENLPRWILPADVMAEGGLEPGEDSVNILAGMKGLVKGLQLLEALDQGRVVV